MSTRLVSMSEIMRVAPWSLRALGHPFGVAERATRLLAWTEAAVGNALKLLRVGEAALRKSLTAPGAARRLEEGGARTLEANGRNLLELGPPAIDLLTSDVRTRGYGEIVVYGAIGALLLPAMADLAARRGLSSIVTYAMDPGDIAFDEFPKSGWIQAVPGVGAPRFVCGTLDSLKKASVRLEGPAAPTAARHADLCASAAASPNGVIAAFATPVPMADLTEFGTVSDFSERVSRAYRNGLQAATEDLAHLYDLERITWAPTSERSRKQAGY